MSLEMYKRIGHEANHPLFFAGYRLSLPDTPKSHKPDTWVALLNSR